jgi:hypothetical protein
MSLREESGDGTPPADGQAGLSATSGTPADEAATPARPGEPGRSGTGAGRKPRSAVRAVIYGATVVVGAIALGSLATAILLHGRARARPAPPRLPPVFRLNPGECLNSAPNASSAVHVVPCAQPHDGEVFAAFALAGRSWPGSAAVRARAGAGCMSRLGSYLNPQLATVTLAQYYIYPSPGAWAVGERTVICEIRSTQGKLTGSVRGLG